MQRQRGPPDSSLRLRRVSVLLCDEGRYARWLICATNPTHTCQNATTLAGAGHAKSISREKPQLQLQIFSSTRGFEAIQIWWLLHSSWRGDAESWALHWYAQFTYCLCVHLLIWRTDAARFFCGGHSGRLARITIIWHYPAVSWNFKQSDNS